MGSPDHWLGTDELGRDEWSRLLYGGRTTMLAGVVASLISTAIGVIMGLIAGYSGWIIETVIMRILDVLMSFPFILLAILIVACRAIDTTCFISNRRGYCTVFRKDYSLRSSESP